MSMLSPPVTPSPDCDEYCETERPRNGPARKLGEAMKSLPVGTAYSVWVGVGAVGTVALGIALFDEPMNAGRLVSVALIVAGIVGLKLATPA